MDKCIAIYYYQFVIAYQNKSVEYAICHENEKTVQLCRLSDTFVYIIYVYIYTYVYATPPEAYQFSCLTVFHSGCCRFLPSKTTTNLSFI